MSFLTDRPKQAVLNNKQSLSHKVISGVLQGMRNTIVVAPLLFKIYINYHVLNKA